MEHIDFVLWMIGYPVASTAIEIAEYKWGKRHESSDNLKGLAAALHIIIWLGIGTILLGA